MHVIATAGHVDHGKSTLVRALTGTEPDRWAEERRRGMTIGLGYAWTEIDGVDLAFVDVPGHERFVTTMLAGVGPVPAVLFVVAADEGWMPQSAEHLAVLDALEVRHGLLVLTRCDLADPTAATEQALAHLGGTNLGRVPTVAVSAATGAGMAELRAALVALARSLPTPDREADVRLWVDRSFSITGAGTVVTGTLAAGTIAAGDRLRTTGGEPLQVRGVQTLSRPVESAGAVARVALNLRGVEPAALPRGSALLRPGAFLTTDLVDVRLPAGDWPQRLTAHIGSAAVPARVRRLGPTSARLRLGTPLPLRVGDRLVLRDPGQHEVAAGADVLDPDPPPLTRRGAAAARGAELDSVTGAEELAALQLRRHGFLRPDRFRVLGLSAPAQPTVAGWHVDPDHVRALTASARAEVARWRARNPLRQDMPLEELRNRLGVPDRDLMRHLAERAGLAAATERPLPDAVRRAVDAVLADLAGDPFAAPDANRLRALGLGVRELAAAARTGALLRIGEDVVLAPDAATRAAATLGRLPQPFTVSQARQALGTSRRVAVPLLEHLDSLRLTVRGPDNTRTTSGRAAAPVA